LGKVVCPLKIRKEEDNRQKVYVWELVLRGEFHV